VERGENEMTGFGGRDRQLNRFEVAQFPHQDHVGSSRNAALRALLKLLVSSLSWR